MRESCQVPAKTEEEDNSWKPLLLFISLRLGLSDINPVYIPGLKASFTLPASLGVIGGRPNHALYFLGFVEDELVFLDPHTTQPATPEQVEEGEVHEEEDASYHCPRFELVIVCTYFDKSCKLLHTLLPSYRPWRINFVHTFCLGGSILLIIFTFLLSYRPGRINIAQLDPSLSLAFLCKTEQEFDNLCIGIQVCTDGVDKNPFASEGQTTGLHSILFCCLELVSFRRRC